MHVAYFTLHFPSVSKPLDEELQCQVTHSIFHVVLVQEHTQHCGINIFNTIGALANKADLIYVFTDIFHAAFSLS